MTGVTSGNRFGLRSLQIFGNISGQDLKVKHQPITEKKTRPVTHTPKRFSKQKQLLWKDPPNGRSGRFCIFVLFHISSDPYWPRPFLHQHGPEGSKKVSPFSISRNICELRVNYRTDVTSRLKAPTDFSGYLQLIKWAQADGHTGKLWDLWGSNPASLIRRKCKSNSKINSHCDRLWEMLRHQLQIRQPAAHLGSFYKRLSATTSCHFLK